MLNNLSPQPLVFRYSIRLHSPAPEKFSDMQFDVMLPNMAGGYFREKTSHIKRMEAW